MKEYLKEMGYHIVDINTMIECEPVYILEKENALYTIKHWDLERNYLQYNENLTSLIKIS